MNVWDKRKWSPQLCLEGMGRWAQSRTPGREKVGKREVREESSRENKRTFKERKRHFKVYWRVFEKSAADHGWVGQPESKERGLMA